MALIDKVRASLYITSSATDTNIQTYIDAALDDMRRVGVRPELLVDGAGISPMVVNAVVAHVNAYYNVNAVSTPYWIQSYNHMVTALMNSDRSTYLHEDEPEPEPEPEPDGGGGDG